MGFHYIPFSLFVLITLFHVYMGLGGKINKDAILPKIKGKDLPLSFRSSLAGCFITGLKHARLCSGNANNTRISASSIFNLFGYINWRGTHVSWGFWPCIFSSPQYDY